jgi:hypothetical protein
MTFKQFNFQGWSNMKKIKLLLMTSMAAFVFAGCASSQMKARKEQREQVSKNAKLYCEFINGEVYPDIDVALNLEMAKRCDSEKPYSISQYRTPSENQGIMYCCSTAAAKNGAPEKADDLLDDSKKDAAKPAGKK